MRVAVCQLNARDDRAGNLRVARELLQRATDAGADLAVLPEYVDYLGRSQGAPKPEWMEKGIPYKPAPTTPMTQPMVTEGQK